jgi:hypothetical protein
MTSPAGCVFPVRFFCTSISSVTPVRFVTRCTELTAHGFIPKYFLLSWGNKTIPRVHHCVDVRDGLPSQSFEQPATLHFERLGDSPTPPARTMAGQCTLTPPLPENVVGLRMEPRMVSSLRTDDSRIFLAMG